MIEFNYHPTNLERWPDTKVYKDTQFRVSVRAGDIISIREENLGINSDFPQIQLFTVITVDGLGNCVLAEPYEAVVEKIKEVTS